MENFDDNILMAKSVSDGQMGMTARDPSHRLAGKIFCTFQKYSLLPLFVFYFNSLKAKKYHLRWR